MHTKYFSPPTFVGGFYFLFHCMTTTTFDGFDEVFVVGNSLPSAWRVYLRDDTDRERIQVSETSWFSEKVEQKLIDTHTKVLLIFEWAYGFSFARHAMFFARMYGPYASGLQTCIVTLVSEKCRSLYKRDAKKHADFYPGQIHYLEVPEQWIDLAEVTRQVVNH